MPPIPPLPTAVTRLMPDARLCSHDDCPNVALPGKTVCRIHTPHRLVQVDCTPERGPELADAGYDLLYVQTTQAGTVIQTWGKLVDDQG